MLLILIIIIIVTATTNNNHESCKYYYLASCSQRLLSAGGFSWFLEEKSYPRAGALCLCSDRRAEAMPAVQAEALHHCFWRDQWWHNRKWPAQIFSYPLERKAANIVLLHIMLSGVYGIQFMMYMLQHLAKSMWTPPNYRVLVATVTNSWQKLRTNLYRAYDTSFTSLWKSKSVKFPRKL